MGIGALYTEENWPWPAFLLGVKEARVISDQRTGNREGDAAGQKGG